MTGPTSRTTRDSREWTGTGRAFASPPGLRLVVPGWPQLAWGQVERGGVLLGSFGVALAAGLLAWGTWVSWCFLAFGFVAHVSSTTDAIRQGSFPAYSRRTALPMIAGSLAAVLYLPALLALIATAWPGAVPDRSRSVYLVNCWAYHGTGPKRGHWVWLHLPPGGGLRTARVVAVAGQEVEWTGDRWRVDGQILTLLTPLRTSAWPQACRFKVPTDQVLVEPEEDDGSPPLPGPLVLVSEDRIIGRAWAQYYPVWDRRLL